MRRTVDGRAQAQLAGQAGVRRRVDAGECRRLRRCRRSQKLGCRAESAPGRSSSGRDRRRRKCAELASCRLTSSSVGPIGALTTGPAAYSMLMRRDRRRRSERTSDGSRSARLSRIPKTIRVIVAHRPRAGQALSGDGQWVACFNAWKAAGSLIIVCISRPATLKPASAATGNEHRQRQQQRSDGPIAAEPGAASSAGRCSRAPRPAAAACSAARRCRAKAALIRRHRCR